MSLAYKLRKPRRIFGLMVRPKIAVGNGKIMDHQGSMMMETLIPVEREIAKDNFMAKVTKVSEG